MPKIPTGMRKTAHGSYESRFTINGRRYSVSGKSIRECREKEKARRMEIESGGSGPENAITLDECFLKWETGRLGTVRESTIRTERYIYRIVSDVQLPSSEGRLGAVNLSILERQQLKEAQIALSRRYCVSTVNRGMSIVKAILKSAEEERLIAWNPSKGLRVLRETKKPPRETIHRALTREETDAFFLAAKVLDSWYVPLYRFLLNTGCRFGEAGALMQKDIVGDTIQIRRTLTRGIDGRLIIGRDTKTGHSARTIPARKSALDAIAEQQRQNMRQFVEGACGAMDIPIFRAPRGGLLGARCVGKDIDLICRTAGVERFTAHAFRDTFATRAIESGMHVKTLQEILGHADIGVTMNLYAHVMEDTKRAQMDAVNLGATV